MRCAICYHLYNFKKVKKPWRNVTFNKVSLQLYRRCFSRFLNSTNGTKSRKTSHFNYWQFLHSAYDQIFFSVSAFLTNHLTPHVVSLPLSQRLLRNIGTWPKVWGRIRNRLQTVDSYFLCTHWALCLVTFQQTRKG